MPDVNAAAVRKKTESTNLFILNCRFGEWEKGKD
jgi:hypothetical protein